MEREKIGKEKDIWMLRRKGDKKCEEREIRAEIWIEEKGLACEIRR